jgi:protein SCO1
MPIRINLLVMLVILAMSSACNSRPTRPGAPVSSADCLPDLKLTDQNAQTVYLASLKGTPVLLDFIYTSCPGPCEMMTQRMAKVADQLGPSFGTKIRFVSVTIDPEHDGPQKLLEYAKAQGVNRTGRLFLAGPPEQVAALMSAFKVPRVREPDGSIDHVLAFFLVRGNGGLQGEYSPNHTRPELIAEDIGRFINHG